MSDPFARNRETDLIRPPRIAVPVHSGDEAVPLQRTLGPFITLNSATRNPASKSVELNLPSFYIHRNPLLHVRFVPRWHSYRAVQDNRLRVNVNIGKSGARRPNAELIKKLIHVKGAQAFGQEPIGSVNQCSTATAGRKPGKNSALDNT